MTKIYLIPVLGESCNLKRYQQLISIFQKKGYLVTAVNPDWYSPLKTQIVEVESDSIICGFSFGAVLGYLIAKKYPCKKVIFASMSPIHAFTFKSLKDDYSLHMDDEKATILAKEIKSIKIDLKSLKTDWITVGGEKEELLRGEKVADVLVPGVGHFMSKRYAEVVGKLV